VLSEKILKKNKNDSKCLGERFRMLVKIQRDWDSFRIFWLSMGKANRLKTVAFLEYSSVYFK